MTADKHICVLTRLKAGVAVISDKDTHSWLRLRTNRYFGWSNVSERDASWQVFAGREFAPSGKWTPYSRQSPTGEFCKYLVDPVARIIVIDLPPGPWRQLYALRVVRNVLRWELFLQGAVFLHASCLAFRGNGIALLGDSRGGKTTMLLNLLQEGQWDYVTEDDLTIVPQADGRLLALGWPGCVRVRRKMLAAFPSILAARQKFTHPANHMEENENPDTGLIRIFPEELASIFGCKIVPETTLDAGVWLQWGDNSLTQSLSSNDVMQRLRLSWDILPERKPGARPRLLDLKNPEWQKMVFDPFLLEAYGVPSLREHERNLCCVASGIRGLAVCHHGKVVKFGETI
jgi:hypothetical protein